MSHAIKLVRLSVQHIGAITQRVDLGPFASGVNVISGRNEAGKSTLIEALRAALFERHEARHKKLRSLQTHGTSNAPEVWVELDIGGERVSVHKRFLDRRFAEVRLHREGKVAEGAAAETLLLELLEGQRPGKTGATRSNMGLWGLLWVAQDETAYTDPLDTLDETTRGALSDAIGRQVGQVLGGKLGEQVRARVLNNVARYLTPKMNAPTGELRAAEERAAAADGRVKAIEDAWRANKHLADEHRQLCERLREAEGTLPDLEREHAAAITAEQRVEQLEGRAREAKAEEARAQAVDESVEKEVDTRAALTGEAEHLAAAIAKSDAEAGELSRTFEAAKRAAEVASEVAARAKGEAVTARAEQDAATEDRDRARKRIETARVRRDLQTAEKLFADLADAARRLEAEPIDTRSFEQIDRLAAKASVLRGQLDVDGTRIVVRRGAGEATTYSVGGPATIDILGLGVFEVEPARPGLKRAVDEAENRRTKLDEALFALGVADVASARARHATRAEADREHKALRAQVRKLAPHGLDALEQEVRTTQAELARLDAALAEATRAHLAREESVRGLAKSRIDEAAVNKLRRRERDVAELRAACDAIGTRVELRALTDLRVQEEGAGAPRTLAAGTRMELISTRSTTVLLDAVAEIKFEPRGEDLASTREKLARAERKLAEALQGFSVASVQEAEAFAGAWSQFDARRKQAEEQLAEVAPQGLEALRTATAESRAQSLAVDEALASAKQAATRRARLDVQLSQDRATGEALARLLAFESELRAAEAAVERLQARVRAIGGPVTHGTQRAWPVSRALRPAEVQGVAWEIIPGEGGSELDIDETERRLREAFARAGAVDLDAAKARLRARFVLEAQEDGLRKQLNGVAPEGIEALRGRAAALGCGEASNSVLEHEEASLDLAALDRAVEAGREKASVLAASAERAAEAAARGERERRGLERQLGEIAAVRDEKAARLCVVIEKLEALRMIEPDMKLADRRKARRWERDQAQMNADRALKALDDATPHLLRGEVIRAQGAVDAHRKSVDDLHDKALQCKVLLDKAAVEGRFEDLKEAQGEQSEAAEALTRMQREAAAARLLAEVVEGAYAESQRVFLAPVVKEARPYLSLLRPGTELRMTKGLKLDKVVRDGEEEEFGELSGGTREQLSVIVRLSLARVMARDHRPLPLILDDTLGWTDDARFLAMVRILRDAASELQIILLTCHPARFSRFQAEYSVNLDGLRGAPLPPTEGMAGPPGT